MKRALLVVALLAQLAHAQPPEDFTYTRAKANDSVSMLASEFYGDRSKFPYIIAENRFGFTRARPLSQGQRLRIHSRMRSTMAGIASMFAPRTTMVGGMLASVGKTTRG